jgi:hypothetical protein
MLREGAFRDAELRPRYRGQLRWWRLTVRCGPD